MTIPTGSISGSILLVAKASSLACSATTGSALTRRKRTDRAMLSEASVVALEIMPARPEPASSLNGLL